MKRGIFFVGWLISAVVLLVVVVLIWLASMGLGAIFGEIMANVFRPIVLLLSFAGAVAAAYFLIIKPIQKRAEEGRRMGSMDWVVGFGVPTLIIFFGFAFLSTAGIGITASLEGEPPDLETAFTATESTAARLWYSVLLDSLLISIIVSFMWAGIFDPEPMNIVVRDWKQSSKKFLYKTGFLK